MVKSEITNVRNDRQKFPLSFYSKSITLHEKQHKTHDSVARRDVAFKCRCAMYVTRHWKVKYHSIHPSSFLIKIMDRQT